MGKAFCYRDLIAPESLRVDRKTKFARLVWGFFVDFFVVSKQIRRRFRDFAPKLLHNLLGQVECCTSAPSVQFVTAGLLHPQFTVAKKKLIKILALCNTFDPVCVTQIHSNCCYCFWHGHCCFWHGQASRGRAYTCVVWIPTWRTVLGIVLLVGRGQTIAELIRARVCADVCIGYAFACTPIVLRTLCV